jgi:hypothetical protein
LDEASRVRDETGNSRVGGFFAHKLGVLWLACKPVAFYRYRRRAAVAVLAQLLALALCGVGSLLYLAIADYRRRHGSFNPEPTPEAQPTVAEPSDAQQAVRTTPAATWVELSIKAINQASFRRWINLHDLTHFTREDGTWYFHIHFHEYFFPRFVAARVIEPNGRARDLRAGILRPTQRYCIIVVEAFPIPSVLQLNIAGEPLGASA